jgi:hypothetical protein
VSSATPFQKRLSTVALREYERFHLLRENQEPLKTQIQSYWTALGFPFQNVSIPWSAVFVSWCIQSAGATDQQFRFAPAHGRFVHWAIANHKQKVGSFHGRRPTQYAPALGDLLQNNRGKNNYDFDYAASHQKYESHSAIVVEVGSDNRGRYLRTIGGNESDSVGLKEVRLDAKGRVKNPDGVYIAVVQTLL